MDQVTAAVPEETLHLLELDTILADETFNYRGHITLESVAGLAQDIQKDSLIHAIIVQPYQQASFPKLRWKVVVGHRRYAAHILLRRQDAENTGKWNHINCRIVEPLSEPEALILSIKENTSRENPNVMQEARALRRFQRWGWSVGQIAKELNTYPRWVQIRLNLLDLPEDIQERATSGQLTLHQLQDIYEQPTYEKQIEYTKKCVTYFLQGKGKFKLTPKQVKRNALKDGDLRTRLEVYDLQELIQDSTNQLQHPAAMALGWVTGDINTEELYDYIEAWTKLAGGKFERPETK